MPRYEWTCPLCKEVIDSVGPVTLAMEKRGHNNAYHPLGDQTKIPHTWQCPRCPEYLSRSDEASLTLAIKGHDIYKHWKEDQPQEATKWTNDVFDSKAEFVQMVGRTPDDATFLADMKIRW